MVVYRYKWRFDPVDGVLYLLVNDEVSWETKLTFAPTFLWLNGRATTTDDSTYVTIGTIPVTTDTTITLEAMVNGFDTGDNVAGFHAMGVFKNVDGTVTQVDSTEFYLSTAEDSKMDMIYDISGTDVLIKVRGAGVTMDWNCNFRAQIIARPEV